ncbi:MAG: hypothetical protein LAT63_04615 [Marinobacter sp.]|nr:hypothetical protein [Marinobacter sp.]
MDSQNNDREMFESAIRALEAEIAFIGVHLTVDSSARQLYSRQVSAMASDLRLQATTGRISWRQAAEQAQEARNLIMDIVRSRSTPIGLAIAQRLKSEGKTLNELIAKKSQRLYGRDAVFDRLTVSQ